MEETYLRYLSEELRAIGVPDFGSGNRELVKRDQ